MKQDKAIRKALTTHHIPTLSGGFNTRMMHQLYELAEKKRKRVYAFSLSIISLVSLGLVSMGIYLLKDYIPSDITLHLLDSGNLMHTLSRYGFSLYIASLILILIALDNWFRQYRQKRNNHHSNGVN
jgi:hypothetical protein